MTRPVVHLELHTGDREGACAFYAQLCGWKPTPISSYLSMALGRGLGGGIVECETERPLWLPYVAVEDVARATARACDAGAELRLDPREGPAGWRSVVASPTGGELAFWQPKR